MAYNQPYLVFPIRNYYPTSPILFWTQFCMVHTQHIWLHWTVTYKLEACPNNKGLASLQTGLLIIFHTCLDMALPFSTANHSNILYWILLSHHPDVIIIISYSSSTDTDRNAEFIPPPAEQVLQLISNIKHAPTKHTRSVTAIQWWCRLCKRTSKLHQSNPASCPATLRSHEHVW